MKKIRIVPRRDERFGAEVRVRARYRAVRGGFVSRKWIRHRNEP